MNRENWAAIIRQFIQLVGTKAPDSWIDNLVTDGRYAWKIFLDLDSEKYVLDIGCGLGNLVKNIAPHAKKTYGMDLTYRRLEFTKKRTSYFNSNDDIALVAGGDGKYLPFLDKSIDCVILSGVLEWVGEGETSLFYNGSKLSRLCYMVSSFFGPSNPRNIQVSFLKEIRRILRDDGELFVGIENRLNYEYFIGRADHHSGLLYGSLLPRLLANLYSIVKMKRPYRTYTYSIPGYKKLFKAAGFNDTKFLGLEKGYSFLNKITPCYGDFEGWRSEPVTGIKDKIKKNRYFYPAYGILASNNSRARESLHDRLLNEIVEKLANTFSEKKISITQYLVTGKDKLVMDGSNGPYNIIIKVPLNDSAVAAEEQNMKMLRALSKSTITPTFLTKVNIGRLPCYVEEKFAGNSVFEKINEIDKKVLFRKAFALIEKVNPDSQNKGCVTFEDELFSDYVIQPLQTILEITGDHNGYELLANYFKRHLYGMDVLTGVCHGDLSANNLLLMDDLHNRIGLIDWEAGSLKGLPILDMINLAGSVHRVLTPNAEMIGTISALIDPSYKGKEGWEFLDRCYKRFKTDQAMHCPLVYLNWLHNLKTLSNYSLPYDNAAIGRRYASVVEHLAKQ